jgi:hypothetical protein
MAKAYSKLAFLSSFASPFSSFMMLHPSSTLHCWAVRLGQGTRLVVLARFGLGLSSEPPAETFTEAGR